MVQLYINLSKKQHKNLLNGKSVRITNKQLTDESNFDNPVKLDIEPKIYKKLFKAKIKGSGFVLPADSLGKAIKTVGKIANTVSNVADAVKNPVKAITNALNIKPQKMMEIKQLASDANKSINDLAPRVHNLIKGGKLTKGSEEAKKRMAELRARRKKKDIGGSFRAIEGGSFRAI